MCGVPRERATCEKWQKTLAVCRCCHGIPTVNVGAMRTNDKPLARPRIIAFLAAPQTQIMDVAGPFQIFVRASELYQQEYTNAGPPYRVILASTSRDRRVSTNCGIPLIASTSYRHLPNEIDTLLIAGGTGLDTAARNRDLVLWLQRTTARTRRFGSICTGAFLLAAARLLEGKRVTTHWKWADELAQRSDKITVDPDPIFIRDGNTYTTAGITAGMDLALALVEEDLGSSLALRVAREMVLYLRRPGGQSQFSAALNLQASDARPILDLHGWILNNLRRDLSVAQLAARARMSSRTFARQFRAQTGITPARFVERLRIEAARQRLEQTNDTVEKVSRDCGLGTAETMRRAFARTLGVTPVDYRMRFAVRPRNGSKPSVACDRRASDRRGTADKSTTRRRYIRKTR